MKKRCDWLTKEKKRKKKQQDRGIVDFMMIQNHFFADLPKWIDEMLDPRPPSYITYTQADLVYMGLLKNVCGVKTMHGMEESFNEETCIETLKLLSGDRDLSEMPHADTLNYYLEKLSPSCLSHLRIKMVKTLIRMKSFYKGRLLGKYWRVILDGTGLFCFRERHCEHCLSQTVTCSDGKKEKRYFHKVLEAKLVLSENIIISIGSEFIENEKEDVSKQDCEVNAAKRLPERIKEEYPRLPVCIQGDALYEKESLMRLCREKGWHYIFTHKQGCQEGVEESYRFIQKGNAEGVVEKIGKEAGRGEYANDVGETAGKRERMNIYEYSYEDEKKERQRFVWLTDIEVTKKNLEELIEAGCGRWKIENEGFNQQKNGIYRIEHLNSRNKNAMKNHYLLTQVADIVMQLYLSWNPQVRELGQSIKNTSSRLLESFRRHTVTDEDVSYYLRYTTVYLE